MLETNATNAKKKMLEGKEPRASALLGIIIMPETGTFKGSKIEKAMPHPISQCPPHQHHSTIVRMIEQF